jgi:hypothetical protein
MRSEFTDRNSRGVRFSVPSAASAADADWNPKWPERLWEEQAPRSALHHTTRDAQRLCGARTAKCAESRFVSILLYWCSLSGPQVALADWNPPRAALTAFTAFGFRSVSAAEAADSTLKRAPQLSGVGPSRRSDVEYAFGRIQRASRTRTLEKAT